MSYLGHVPRRKVGPPPDHRIMKVRTHAARLPEGRAGSVGGGACACACACVRASRAPRRRRGPLPWRLPAPSRARGGATAARRGARRREGQTRGTCFGAGHPAVRVGSSRARAALRSGLFPRGGAEARAIPPPGLDSAPPAGLPSQGPLWSAAHQRCGSALLSWGAGAAREGAMGPAGRRKTCGLMRGGRWKEGARGCGWGGERELEGSASCSQAVRPERLARGAFSQASVAGAVDADRSAASYAAF